MTVALRATGLGDPTAPPELASRWVRAEHGNLSLARHVPWRVLRRAADRRRGPPVPSIAVQNGSEHTRRAGLVRTWPQRK